MDNGSRKELEARSLTARAECKAVEVVSGDSYWSITQSCGITQQELEKYNPIDRLCEPNVLQIGQTLCCSEGSLPDYSPKPDADENCLAHTIVKDDTCAKLAAQYKTTVDKIIEVNKQSWGWVNCESLGETQVICLGPGRPPMPSINPDAQCGPQKPGTVRPPDGTNLEELNPCPLNACCDAWGMCGITEEFCTPSPADSGAPGATKPGTNGCFSNCGTDIVNNDQPPKDPFINLAYFEAWNMERPCANLDVLDIPDRYTHVHFAFVDVTPDFAIDTSKVQEQWDRFLKLQHAKRIVSFGGWAFSTENGTYKIFRQAVTKDHREQFSNNLVNFIESNNLDGVDFDWEYPGAPDLPVDDPDDPNNGNVYLEFLSLMREKLPKSKTVAIAAPASFWYLKAYPMGEIAKIVDYVVYMTYDLHGQWDYKNWWARYVNRLFSPFFLFLFSLLVSLQLTVEIFQPWLFPAVGRLRKLPAITHQLDGDRKRPIHDHQGRRSVDKGISRNHQLRSKL